jgi:hypothetical protein
VSALAASAAAKTAFTPGSALVEFPAAGFTPTAHLDLMTVNDQKIGACLRV